MGRGEAGCQKCRVGAGEGVKLTLDFGFSLLSPWVVFLFPIRYMNQLYTSNNPVFLLKLMHGTLQ